MPVLNWHSPLFSSVFDRQVDPLLGGIIAGKYLPLLDGLTNNAVEGFNRVGSVNRFTNVHEIETIGSPIGSIPPTRNQKGCFSRANLAHQSDGDRYQLS